MEPRVDAKRRRLAKLLSIRGVTAPLLRDILQTLGQDPGPASTSQRAVQDALGERFARVGLTIELPLAGGGTWPWKLASPAELLRQCVESCPGYREMVTRALAKHPNNFQNPWRVVLYVDEITPGSVLRPDNKRKISAFYMSFLEFGQQLRFEDAWLTVALIRSSVLHDHHILGGMANVCRLLLRHMFVGPGSMATGGCLLNLQEPVLLFAAFNNFLADEAALKSAFDLKGAAGLLPCMACRNVTSLQADLAENDPTSFLVDISCSDERCFQLNSDHDIWRMQDRLLGIQARSHTKQELQLAEKTMGMNCNPHGILADVELRQFIAPSSYTRDSMHTFLSAGTVSIEMRLLLKSLNRQLGVTYSSLQVFCKAEWKWPAHVQTKGHQIHQAFSAQRERHSGDAFRAGASELLTMYPLVRYFLEKVVERGALCAERESFEALCYVLDLMQQLKRFPSNGVARELASALARHMDSHKRAYGTSNIKPKHHQAMHIPAQVLRDKLLLDCFVHERKHQVIKQCAQNIDNTREFESSVLRRVLNVQFQQLQCERLVDGLGGGAIEALPLAAALGAEHAWTAKDMRWQGMQISIGDLLFCPDGCVLVEACLCVDMELMVLARSLLLQGRASRTTSTWARTETLNAVRLEPGFRHPACWTVQGNGLILALGA